jgi:hypothetical protein
MARVKIQAIVSRLSAEMRRALEDAVKRTVRDDGTFDAHTLFREFERAVRRRFSTWVRVPDDYVEMEE